jgi:ribosomal protein S18 acetylase RimI-like enzyme
MVMPGRQFPLIDIRHATADDASLLAQLGEVTFFDSFAADNTPEDMAAYIRSAFSTEKQAAELADPGSLFLVASVEGEVAGYARLYAGQPAEGVTGERPVELVRFYSTRPWIGRGVGPALMAACLSEARELGYDTIWLGVWERNERAIAFYRKWGFRVAGTHSFLLGADWQTDYVMVKVLASRGVDKMREAPEDAR